MVSIKSHRNSPINDRLYSTWPDGKENLVVVCAKDKAEKEVCFFGAGDVCQQTKEHFAALKQRRIEADPSEPARRGIYHTVGGGVEFGKADGIARCLVVANDPEEVISYVHQLEAAKKHTIPEGGAK